MPQPSIVPRILALLEPYLEQADITWEAQPSTSRQPTLPTTDDGKVNVRAVTLALGLRQTQEQHFYRHAELANMVNAVARVQGLKPIKSRVLDDSADEAVAKRMSKIQARSGSLEKILGEREALIERQRREIEALREQLRLIEETGMALRTQEPR